MPNSSAIDGALVSTLLNDATLMALMTDGVFFDEAKPNAQKFVLVSVVDAHDEGKFGGRAYEDILYLVKAVELSTSGTNATSAAARIDVLLEDQMLSAAGYTWMTVHREARIRATEVDEIDRSIRWQHRGGHYRVQMSL